MSHSRATPHARVTSPAGPGDTTVYVFAILSLAVLWAATLLRRRRPAPQRPTGGERATAGPAPSAAVVIPPRTTAAVIAAHNEEAVIGATLASVLRVFAPADVFIFCDGCTDRTVSIARSFLPAGNVIDHEQNIGKSRALEHTLRTRVYPAGYVYVSILDADTTLDERFLVNTLKVLRRKTVACAVGQVKSRWYPTNVISVYRTFIYALWQMVFKRLQSLLNAITIASGCASTWKVRVLRQLEFDHRLSTEDFDLTIQVHRKRLGAIKYASSAVVWTQDPFTVTSYRRQIYRWNRAWWESVRKHRVGLQWLHLRRDRSFGISALDVSTFLLLVDILRYSLALLILPLLLIRPVDLHLGLITATTREAVLFALAWQYGSTIALSVIVAALTRRPRIALYSPLFLFFAYLETFVSVQTLASTTRRLYRRTPPVVGVEASIWLSPERRKVA